MKILKPEDQPVTYWDYLKIDTLLSLQNGIDVESDISSDELLFIVVHQTFELWFKLIIQELRLIQVNLSKHYVPEEQIPYIVQHLKRIIEILKLGDPQFTVLETLNPQDFLAFRGKLGTASGFQSIQMREIEILMGLEKNQRFPLGDKDALDYIERAASVTPEGKDHWQKIQKVQNEFTLKEALNIWLFRTPIYGSSPDDTNDAEIVEKFIAEYLKKYENLLDEQEKNIQHLQLDEYESIKKRFHQSKDIAKNFLYATDISPEQREKYKRMRAGILFIESYRDLPLLTWPRTLLDTIVELEQRFVLWRTRHARMVERMIGRRVGTGGSSGVDYLDETTKYRIFTDLWTVRTVLLPKSLLPPINKEYYEFLSQET